METARQFLNRWIKAFNGPVLDFRQMLPAHTRAEAQPPRQYWRMAKQDEAKSADIFLYDVIGETWDGEGTTSKQFAKDLKALGNVDTLNIFINSPGGVVFEGVAIYNQLVRHKAQKIVTVDGLAASIASVVAMAGDQILMPKNAMMMIHNAWAAAIIAGDSKTFRKEANDIADRLDMISATITQTYIDRTGLDQKKIAAMMDEETWFNGEEAVASGFADTLIERELEPAAFAPHNLTGFRNIPKSLADALARSKAEDGKPSADSSGTVQAPHPAIARAFAHITKLGIKKTV